MTEFGKRNGGGRRVAGRITAPLLATLTTTGKRHVAALVDISDTGARLRGDDLPAEGTDVLMSVDRLRAFGTVCWRHDGDCGLQFDEPLAPQALTSIRREVAKAGGVPLAMRAALEDWIVGKAR